MKYFVSTRLTIFTAILTLNVFSVYMLLLLFFLLFVKRFTVVVFISITIQKLHYLDYDFVCSWNEM